MVKKYKIKIKEKIEAIAPILIVLISIVILWEIFVRALQIPKVVLPAPSNLLTVFATRASYLLTQAQVTVYETVAGFITAVVLGIAFAILVVQSKLLERTLYPLLVASQVIPKSALAPIFLLWLGYGISSKILIAFLIAFFPITVNAILGMRDTDPDLINFAKSLKVGKWRILSKVRLPNSLPHVFSGLKVAICFALVGAVIGEFIGGDKGLGFVIIYGTYILDIPLLFAALIFLTVIGLILFGVVLALERLLLPWYVIKVEETISA